MVNRDAEAIVRTAVQHTAMTARMQTWIANGITQYEWLSTLDGRTSDICRALDRDVFDIGKGPVPPVHIRCRSSTMSVLPDKYKYLDKGATRASKDGYVKHDLSYYEWLKMQPQAFQDDVLGPTRGQLFRSGEITTERFKQLQLDKNFKPITLAEMRKKEPQAFERLFD
jgi:SPP1 gp7 family putative phage head morphogenesis protein